jgi:HlyD family secretion protein
MRTWRSLAAAFALISVGCDGSGVDSPTFATMVVRVAPLTDSVLAIGRVQTKKSVDVSSQLSGRIDQVYVDFNDVVAEGDPLAKLDQVRFESRVEELNAALAVARAELASAEAALAGAQARLKEDELNYKRKIDLAKRGGASESEVSHADSLKLQSQSALQMLTATKEIKNANIAAAAASLHQAQIDLDRTIIRAPISGIVIKRSIEPGQTVAVSLSAPELFTIANDLREVEVLARVDEADVGKVRVGQTASFTVDAYPGRRFEGSVSQIRKAAEISQNVVTYSVVIVASNPEELMLPGMTALVEIVTARWDRVLQVPNAALSFEMPPGAWPEAVQPADEVKSGVWVVRGKGSHERLQVEVGYSDGEFSEVRSGSLEAGDEVIVGYQR